MLERGWNQRLPYDNLKKNLVDIHPTESSFKIMLDKARHNANRCMQDSLKHSKERCNKSHKLPDFEVGDLLLESNLKFDKIEGPKKIKDSFEEPFMIRELHGPNAGKIELTSA
ncbi:hypothetical protein O181_025800 [Austropuccinia psidii MF-1]|uniref:Uncharacterized protein n=1 Tax=Austropuccinia psidii MF-1 TaxID=1389203 RepID=A0A9Q3H1J8_9BASI|nr:hypothetical protein [Austropuccinia psidii MF-1]